MLELVTWSCYLVDMLGPGGDAGTWLEEQLQLTSLVSSWIISRS